MIKIICLLLSTCALANAAGYATRENCIQVNVIGNLGTGIGGVATGFVDCVQEDYPKPNSLWTPKDCNEMHDSYNWPPCPDVANIGYCTTSYDSCLRLFAWPDNGFFTCCFQYGPYFCADDGDRCHVEAPAKNIKAATLTLDDPAWRIEPDPPRSFNWKAFVVCGMISLGIVLIVLFVVNKTRQ